MVIPNGVDCALFAQAMPVDLTAFAIPTGSRTVVYVGRLDPQKGLPYLLTAAQGICREFDDVHFLLVGEGPERASITDWISDAGLSERIHLAGWRGDIPNFLRAACCLALPSLWEGMPNVVLEAMAAGLPVIATRVEGTAETVIDGETGLLVDPASASALESALQAVLRDPQRGHRMGLAGRRRVESDFSWDAVVARYEAVYRRVLARSSKAADAMG